MKARKMNLVKQTAKLFAILLAFSLIFISLPVQAMTDDQAELGSAGSADLSNLAPTEEAAAWSADRVREKSTLDPARKKLSGKLLSLVSTDFLPNGKTRKQVIGALQKNGQLTTDSGQEAVTATDQDILVYVYVALTPKADIGKLDGLIHEMTDVDVDNNLMAAWIRLADLESLAAMSQVRSLRLIEKPRVQSGLFSSEGDEVLQADLARMSSGQDGTGIKIGIISDGVDHYTSAISSGDLPSTMTVLSNAVGGDEGTAMLEIVHDLAPGAQLYFHDCGTNFIAFNTAIDRLVEAGCDIICDDIGWITAPFFEDGIIAEHVSAISAQNQVLFVSSAGNSGSSHYQGVFHDDGTGVHDFSHGSDPANQQIYVDIPSGGELFVSFQWNEPFGLASSDYDLYLVDSLTDTLLDASEDDQTITGEPSEVIDYVNTTGTGLVAEVIVVAYAAPVPKTLEIYMYERMGTSVLPHNIVAADSIFGHAAVSAAIACGAIDFRSPGSIEYFSSQGPVTMIGDVRQKPDLCGVDGVTISGSGGFGSYYAGSYYFFGTSAAAPHVAAVAALVLANSPSLTAAEVKSKMLSGSVDLGPAGFDPVYGSGRVDALLSISAYTVSFQSNGGSSVASQIVADQSLVIRPADPVKFGFIFAGWYQDAALTDPWDFVNDHVDADLTLYAKWTGQQVTVTFDKNGGTTEADPLTRMVDPGMSVTLPTPPTRTGYSFIGWNTESDGSGAAFTASTTVQGDLTVYAQWLQIPINVRADSAGYNSAKVTWSAVAGADGYDVYRKLWSTGPYVLVASPTSTSLTNTGLVMGKTYYYMVRAYRLVDSTKMVTADSKADGVTPTLSAPVGLKLDSFTISSARISWSAVAGASGYVVERKMWSTGTYVVVATQTATSLNNTGLLLGKTYYYHVRAYRLVGTARVYSAYSTVIGATPGLSAPTGLSAKTTGSGRVQAAWTAVPGATGYEVYRKLWSTGAYSLVGSPTTNSLTNTGLANNKTYYYYVRAYRLSGTTKTYSKNSAVVGVAVIPATPTGLQGSAASCTSASLTWTAVSGASGYEVYRKLWSTGTYVLVTSTTTNSLVNTGLATGKTYYYYVRAYWTVGSTRIFSKNSTVVAVVPAPAKPAGLKAATSIPYTATLSWTAVPGATGYAIYRSELSSGVYPLVAETSSPAYLDEGLIAGVTYFYKVKAYRLIGSNKVYGPESAVISCIPRVEEAPLYNVELTDVSGYLDTFTMRIHNNGSKPLIVNGENCFWYDYDYDYITGYLQLTDSSGRSISSVTIAAGASATIYFRVINPPAYYNGRIYTFYELTYDSIRYTAWCRYYSY